MISTLIQIASVTAVALYLTQRYIAARRRNAQSWDSLLARLRPDWNARELTDPDFSRDEPNPAPGEYWRRLWTAHGLWAMYANAGVMLEMADYAERNSDSVDREVLAALRHDVLAIRVNLLKTAAKYACGAARESIAMSALRAESAYAEMMMGVTAFLEANASDAAPAFVAAM